VKFAINSGILAESIAAASSSLPSRPAAAILGGVLVEAQIAAVTFSSFNYDRATSRIAAADVMEPDTAVVSGRLLATVGGNLPKNAESIVTVDGSEMVIATGRTEFRLPLMHVHDYPQLPAMDDGNVIGSVGCAEFTEAVRVIGGFADLSPASESLMNLSALNIGFEPASLVLRGTDRYIVGRRRIDWEGKPADMINVPAGDVLATLKAIAGTSTGDVEILCSKTLFGLRTTSTTIITRVMAVEFPSVERVMAADSYLTAIAVDTAFLASMLKRAAAIADDEHAKVDIIAEDGTLSVVTSGDSSGHIADGVDAVQRGPDRRLSVSSRRMHNALNIIDDQRVTLAFKKKDDYLVSMYPGLIEPAGDVLRPPDTDSVVMLMGIKGT
jgi:DNA polymerase-3 subunit beta